MSIKAAIEALDRATKGPLSADRDTILDANGKLVAIMFRAGRSDIRILNNAKLLAAAPQMAALIKRMVPYLQEYWQSIAQGPNVLKDGNPARLGDIEAILKEAGE